MSRILPAALCLLAAPAVAQITGYVPGGNATVEGNSTFTYPFGRATGGIQVLVDGSVLRQTFSAMLLSVAFRPNGVLIGGTT